MAPPLGSTKPAIICRVVVLPQPDGPSNETNSPFSTSRESPSTAVCVPKGRPAALGYVSDFIEEAKASGLVRKALDEMGLTSSQIAPAGMKP